MEIRKKERKNLYRKDTPTRQDMCRTMNVASVLIYGTYQPHDAHLIGQDK